MESIKRFAYAVALLMLAGVANARQAISAGDAPNIVSLNIQQCKGPAATGWVVHPLRQQFQGQGWMPFGDTGYRIDFASLGRFREWTIAERLHDRSRKVDDSYVLLSPSGTGPYQAAFVVTRMAPGEAMSDEALLQQAISLAATNAGDGTPSFVKTETPFGQGVEMVVGGRVGSHCFPTARFFYASAPGEASIGISRFVVRDGDLLEYALVLPWPEGVPQAEMISKAQAELSVLQSALSIMPAR